jgi:flavin reductase (DIM6/NTAB) family NADH-FMN oxidoreductase RutF
MADEFLDVRILDNFYQTSSFFPMPVVLMSTFAESGKTNLGPYSLCFPHIVTKQGDHAMMLICRATSNTARNIVRTKVCAINFIPDKKKYLKNCVMLGFPGETTEEKMKHSIFTLLPSGSYGAPPARAGQASYPEIVKETIQVFLCTWDESYPLQHNEFETYYFLLRIDRIIMHKKWRDRMFRGKGLPTLPIDYGYRDNVRFWFATHRRPYAVPIPEGKGNPIEAVRYACDRFDPEIRWELEACAKIVKVPRIFLNRVIAGVVAEAKKEGVTVITAAFMDKVQDKRSAEK